MSRRVIATMKVHSNGRIQIPVEVRRRLHLEDGDTLHWLVNNQGEYCIEKGYSLEKERASFSTKPWP